MKKYKQVYLIAKDRGFKYEPVANSPEFSNEKEALDYWQYNENRILDTNFYDDPIVIIRREINNVMSKERYDIFDYVVGNSTFDPIEKCIDPIRYEVFDTFIFDNKAKCNIDQDEQFRDFGEQVAKLRIRARKMQRDEIDRLCEELEEIAPVSISL